ncbi:hypothetical protein CEXT_130911 [Caerostris extrusa]|uniref:Uncharacterized protein n=1 Tax=Caerostris extrusa TaxID=172846 RepID=A0AAV4S257_CAEEX|nr:hypothetical protein CEXT_130911 [Caerostris extrusa]
MQQEISLLGLSVFCGYPYLNQTVFRAGPTNLVAGNQESGLISTSGSPSKVNRQTNLKSCVLGTLLEK